jgi:Protein of unknown function (DUF1194)
MPILGLPGGAIAVGALVLGCCSGGGRAAEIPVDLELVLAIDASGSVNAREFDLQQRGIAMAFRDPEVLEAIATTTPQGLAVTVVQWSGRGQQHTAIDWTLLGDRASALAFADRVDTFGRLVTGETALFEALAFAITRLEQNGFAGARRTIDISGDGPSNGRLAPDTVRDAAAAAGITINGLAIVNEAPELDLYYAWNVIGGPGAFLITAKDYRDFADAMRLKLLQEIRGGPIAARPGPRFASYRAP